jgi:hypothetical protein
MCAEDQRIDLIRGKLNYCLYSGQQDVPHAYWSMKLLTQDYCRRYASNSGIDLPTNTCLAIIDQVLFLDADDINPTSSFQLCRLLILDVELKSFCQKHLLNDQSISEHKLKIVTEALALI